MIPPWLEAEAARLLRQVKPGVAKELGGQILPVLVGAKDRRELAIGVLRKAAEQPVVRSVIDRIREDLEVLRQAEQDRREGKR